MARTTARHKGHDFLGIYLNDHLAGATGGVGLARRMAAAADPRSESARGLSTLAAEIAQDRVALMKIMSGLGIPVRGYKMFAGSHRAGRRNDMRLSLAAAATAGAAAAVAAYRRRQPQDDLTGEVAMVTGSSRGLGLLVATELARRGCRLLLCARDGAELERAADWLRSTGAEVAAVTCDVTREESAGQLVDAAVKHYGRLDILVNNAGIIRVGPVQSTSPADYEAALATMTMAPVRLALAALPVMRAQGHGRIVTITSIGGKLSVPHLLPYSTAKFAAVGFSEGLRAELAGGPVTVTTVVPGLMRTGSHVRAEFAGRKNQEFTWFSLGASLPLVSMDAERAAAQIVAAMAARRPEVFLTPAGQVVGRLAGLVPEVTAPVLHAVQNIVLPAPDRDGAAVPGRELHPTLPGSVFGVLTSLGRAAAARFNELGRTPGSNKGEDRD